MYVFCREECSDKGGTSIGSCAEGYGVCCTCKFSNYQMMSQMHKNFQVTTMIFAVFKTFVVVVTIDLICWTASEIFRGRIQQAKEVFLIQSKLIF